MKLAEALLLRSEMENKKNNLKSRILSYTKIQEGDKAPENTESLLKELFILEDKMKELIIRINQTNNETLLENDETISKALVKRESLLQKRQFIHQIIEHASEMDYRLTHTEIKTELTLDISTLQKEMDQLSKEFRELDTSIQKTNWTTDLL